MQLKSDFSQAHETEEICTDLQAWPSQVFIFTNKTIGSDLEHCTDIDVPFSYVPFWDTIGYTRFDQ